MVLEVGGGKRLLWYLVLAARYGEEGGTIDDGRRGESIFCVEEKFD